MLGPRFECLFSVTLLPIHPKVRLAPTSVGVLVLNDPPASNDRFEWCASDRLGRQLLRDNADFTVIGVLGTEGRARQYCSPRHRVTFSSRDEGLNYFAC